MSRTVTALYDTQAEAEAARQRLSSEVDVNSVRIIDKNSGGSGQSGGLDSVYMSNEDRHAYGEGLRRGGFMLCADVGSDEDADRIVRLLEESACVDLDERQQSWRSEGWQPQATGGPQSVIGQSSGAQTRGSVVEEERIPVVEEELRVGKREVTRGGARVRSYVREIPVHEQVTLREEHVNVERRPVNQPASTTATTAAAGAADLLQERTIEMRETAEEAVVQKVANVREEVVVRKTAEERTEQIDDTVRRTEIEVDENAGGNRSAFGSFGNSDGQTSTSRASDLERERDPSR